MAKVKIPYYVVRRGRGFWQPTKAMRDAGFEARPCGPDGPLAWQVAAEWTERWHTHRAAQAEQEKPRYVLGTMGEAFERYRKPPAREWLAKAPRTRENWLRAWRHIEPQFADNVPRLITVEMVSDWRADIAARHGPHEAFNAIKIWRALWRVMVAYRYVTADDDPSQGLANTAPRGRSATFTEGEAVQLVKTLWRSGARGTACIVAICWDTSFAPVDARTLTLRDAVEIRGRLIFVKARGKTDAPAIGTLSRRTEALVRAWLAERTSGGEVELMPDAPLFLTEKGRPHSKEHLAKLFRGALRQLWPGDTRKLMDMRRSGAVEAHAGEVEALALSAKMANSLASSAALQQTYLPRRLATVLAVDEARRRGRRRLRESEG